MEDEPAPETFFLNNFQDNWQRTINVNLCNNPKFLQTSQIDFSECLGQSKNRNAPDRVVK